MTRAAHSSANEGHDEHQNHAAEAEHVRPKAITVTAQILGIVEEVILAFIAIVLIVLAVLLLIDSGSQLYEVVKSKGLAGLNPPTITSTPNNTSQSNSSSDTSEETGATLTILESILLVAVIMEIVYTVTLSLRSHELSAEPFLIIGIIAAIRRILEITIKSSNLKSDSQTFQWLLVELGILSVIVIALAASVYIVRRSQKFVLKLPSAALAPHVEPKEDH